MFISSARSLYVEIYAPISATINSESYKEEAPPVQVSAGRLSIHADQLLLHWVLEQISEASGIQLKGTEMIGEQIISMVFDDLPLSQALVHKVIPKKSPGDT